MYKPLYDRRWKYIYTIIGDDKYNHSSAYGKTQSFMEIYETIKGHRCGPPFSLYNVKTTTMERAAFQLEL